ncbi:MAG TPA: bacillithiol biosynthesis cysteine-adding enzyme BshC [Catalimonadaceae bacterium]|nr:bacillithiol biosynthesis cysteine-adding enzyme BshC [Catalimonadaceae bacterium]
MKRTSYSYNRFKAFSPTLISYVENDPQLKDFSYGKPELTSFPDAVKRKAAHYPDTIRQKLAGQLQQQHAVFPLHPLQNQNLELLKKNNTFSVSCGHQLVLGGGPMYMAFKILSVVKLANDLSREFPEQHFVPIFWMASEDHDVEEIRSFSFFAQPYSINVNGEGPVGRISTDGIEEQLSAIKDFPSWMAAAFGQYKTMSEATRAWLQYAFGDRGLLILDADSRELKKELLPVLLKELQSDESEKKVLSASAKLEAMGLKSQIHPRNVNLFYTKEHQRIRLERTESGIRTLDGSQSWTMEEALSHFSAHPEELSPNVCLRPVYSQILMPDVAFIGGPAEIAYWLQLKDVFDGFEIPFPLLVPRFSALYIPVSQGKKLSKLGLQSDDLTLDELTVRKNLVKPENEIELPDLEKVYSQLLDWAQKTDPTLVPAGKAELSKMAKMAESFQKRIQKTAEAKEEQKLKQVTQLWDRFFPGGGLQERTESWLSFFVTDPNWLNKVYDAINPLDFRFHILEEEPELPAA